LEREYKVFSLLCDVMVITLTGGVDVDLVWIDSPLISGTAGIHLVRDNIRWFSRIRLPMISPRGIRGRIYILIDGRLFPLQAVDDFFQVGQQ
jgi:hypothetical protein